MKKQILKSFVLIFLTFMLVIATNVSFDKIFSLPENFVASYDEVKDSNLSKKFGSLVQASLNNKFTGASNVKSSEGEIVFKLFGFIPIRKVKVKIAPEEDVYIGGVPIGINVITSGAIVVEENMVEVDGDKLFTQKSEPLKKGDIIYEVAGQKIEVLEDISSAIKNSNSGEVDVKFYREGKEMSSKIKYLKDSENNLKLGLIVRDDVSGVGTLTYVNSKTGKFGALGHAITEEKNVIDASGGEIYACNLLGITKGQKNSPGQLRCVFLQGQSQKGKIFLNNKYGIFGQVFDKDGIVDENLTCKIGGRLSVSPGKASIVSSVSGIREEYEIEIIKASFQSTSDDKSIVFRVTDKRLLDLTGGIVQGMSGSPIIQNGKMIGAVTHVFVSDPTKGYGVYSDWMLLNS